MATKIGIQIVFIPIFDAFAVVTTGTRISATTAGRIPINIRVRTSLFFITSGVRNIAMAKMIRKDGKTVPSAAHKLPFSFESLSPITTDIFTAKTPGSD